MGIGLFDLLAIAVGLSLDAFAASIVQGMSARGSPARLPGGSPDRLPGGSPARLCAGPGAGSGNGLRFGLGGSVAASALSAGLYFGGFQALMPVLGYLAGSAFAEAITAFDHWVAFGLLAIIGGRMAYGGLKGGGLGGSGSPGGSGGLGGSGGSANVPVAGVQCGDGNAPVSEESGASNRGVASEQAANAPEADSVAVGAGQSVLSAMKRALNPRVMGPLAFATSIDALAVGVSFAFLQVGIAETALSIGAVTFCLSAVGVCAGAAFGAKLKEKAEIAGGVALVVIGMKILFEHLGVFAKLGEALACGILAK